MAAQEITVRQGHRLLQEMQRERTALRSIRGRRMQYPDVKGDWVDQASYRREEDIDQTLYRLHQQVVRRLEQALVRLGNGQYGICERCGKQIDPARLDAMPYAALCVGCQHRNEQRRY